MAKFYNLPIPFLRTFTNGVIKSVVDTSDYFTLVTSFSDVPATSILSLFFLGLMRIAPIVSIAPFLGAKLPLPVKMGLTIALSAIVLPYLITTVGRPAPSFDMMFAIYSLKEFFLGFVIAFLVTIPFQIMQASGILIDFLRGSSALMVTDPLMQNQVSPIGVLYNYIFVVLFYQIEGPFIFLQGLLNSYSLIPIDGFISSSFFITTGPFWKAIFSLLTKFTALAIQLASPSILAILMAEMFLGIANRLAAQVQIAFLGMALKSLLGLALLWAGWFFILKQVAKQSLLWLTTLDQLIHSIPRG